MKILFITATNLGDGVLTTGALNHLIQTYPDARITVACGPVVTTLFAAAPGVERVISMKKQPYAGHWRRLAAETLFQKWDIVADMRNSALSRFFWAGKRYIWSSQSDIRHKVEQVGDVLELSTPPAPHIWLDAQSRQTAAELIPDGGPVLALGPAARWPGKTWPHENFSALAEVRKHPGVTASSLVALAAGAAVVLYLTQRSGPTRYQRIKTRIDPRGWVDTEDLRDRFHDAVDAFRHRAEDAGERAGDFSREARHRAADAAHDARDRADEWFRSTRKGSRKALKKHGKAARRYADDAGAYARDHAREGGALLAVATIAAAVGAAVLESRRPDSHVRRIARF